MLACCLALVRPKRIDPETMSENKIEIRSELRFERGDAYDGPGRLSGVLVRYGDEAVINSGGRRERFEARSIFLSPNISLNREHRPESIVVAALGRNLRLNDGPDDLRVEVELPNTAAGREAATDVRSGALRGFSSEFRALEETDERGVRVIRSAVLQALGLVASPAYRDSTVEIRKRIEGRAFWL